VILEKLRTPAQAEIVRQHGFVLVEIQVSRDTQYARASRQGVDITDLKKQLEHPHRAGHYRPDLMVSGSARRKRCAACFLHMARRHSRESRMKTYFPYRDGYRTMKTWTDQGDAWAEAHKRTKKYRADHKPVGVMFDSRMSWTASLGPSLMRSWSRNPSGSGRPRSRRRAWIPSSPRVGRW
jgi:hypothetical protein